MFPVETHQQSDPLVGAVLDGRYRVDTLIATGGMSGVYRGLDLRLDRPVALKIMDSRYAGDSQFLTRFQREARAVARLKDPGLVAVYDQGIDGHHPFLVMELVEGGTLRELLVERGPMPPHAVAAVLAPVLGGLAVAHHEGLVHRDVKPENVLISDGGDVKIADFGLVRAIAEAKITSTSVILGTAAYLSPEQVSTGDADSRQRRLRRRHPHLRAADRRHPVHRRHRTDGRLPADGPRRRTAKHRDRRGANSNSTSWCCARPREIPPTATPMPRTWQPNSRRSSTSWGCPTSGCPRRATRRSICRRRCTAAASARTPPPTPSAPHRRASTPRQLTRGPDDWQTDDPATESHGVAAQFAGIDMDEFYWARQRAKRAAVLLGDRGARSHRRARRGRVDDRQQPVRLDLAASQSRSISATRNANSSDCWVLSRGSHAVS